MSMSAAKEDLIIRNAIKDTSKHDSLLTLRSEDES
jgi:hypothetical protein